RAACDPPPWSRTRSFRIRPTSRRWPASPASSCRCEKACVSRVTGPMSGENLAWEVRMRPTLVTGANGHVGNNICRLLVQRGEPVRAMIRSSADPAALEGLDVQVVYGDILDPADLPPAVAGCGRVYHTAAGFLTWAADPEHAIIRPSVDGTRNIVKAAAKAGVEKLLYVSTGGTIGFSPTPDTRRTEADYNKAAHTPYFIGKIAAEREAFAIGEREKL